MKDKKTAPKNINKIVEEKKELKRRGRPRLRVNELFDILKQIDTDKYKDVEDFLKSKI